MVSVSGVVGYKPATPDSKKLDFCLFLCNNMFVDLAISRKKLAVIPSSFEIWVTRVGAVIVLAWMLWQGYNTTKERNQQRIESLQAILMMLYPLGNALKFGLVGPVWLRWHLGDIGFPVAIAYVAWKLLVSKHMPIDAKLKSEQWRQAIRRANAWIVVLVVAIGVSFAYEIMTGFIVGILKRNDPTRPLNIGEFDWVDIACYTAGGLLAIGILVLWRRRARRIWQEVLVAERSVIGPRPPRQNPVPRKRGSRKIRKNGRI